MEQFDILDRNGSPIGLTASKGAPLIDGQYYLGVHAYIHNSSNSFLLQQRAFDKEFLPGGWDIHMGHVIAGETSKEGIMRELKEEVGICVTKMEIRFIGRFIWEIYHHMIDIYFLEFDFDLKKMTLQSNEVIGVKQVSKIEMLHMVSNMHYRPDGYRQIVLNEINHPSSTLQPSSTWADI